MRTLILLTLSLSACGSDALPPAVHPDLEPPASFSVATTSPSCGASLTSICNDETCEVMGTQYPANLSGWCGTNDQFLDGVYSSVPGDSACGGLTLVNAPVGDGSLALFYDQSGRIWSIMRWRSAPPCEGACELTCVAGGAPTTSVTKCVPSVELECGV